MRWLALLVLFVAPVWAGDAEEAASVTDPKLRAAINGAIRKGAVYLQRTQERDGSWSYGNRAQYRGGTTAIALYALAASGVPSSNEHIQRGIHWTQTHGGAYRSDADYATYASSLLLLALARIDAEAHKAAIHRLATRIANGQNADGTWTYGLSTRKRPGDISNTQFAVMALWMAEMRAGFKVPKRTWKRVQRLFRDGQTKEGGWGYHAGSAHASPTMTAAGLFGIVVSTAALAKGRDPLAKARDTSAARRGWHQLRSTRPYGMLYFAYGLERAGTIMDADPAGWYVPGARVIVERQSKDGGWGPSGFRTPRGKPTVTPSNAYSTSLALLFLTRATRYVITPRRPRKAATTARGARFPDPVTDRNLKVAFEAYLLSDVAKRIPLRPLFGTAGGACIEFLIGRLADPDLTVRQTAFDLLTVLLYKPLLFDPKARPDERKIMLVPIRAYWHANEKRYAWNAKTQRFERS